MIEFKVGDKVIVMDNGCQFSTYKDFFGENGLKKWEHFFEYDVKMASGKTYEVVAKGKHSEGLGNYGPLYLLQGENGKVYICNNGRGYMKLAEPAPIHAYDLMKLAAENPKEYEGKRYEVVEGSAMYNNATMKRYTECVIDEGKLCSDGYSMMIFDDTILEEVPPEPEPVTFLEAVEAYERGEVVECALEGCKFVYQKSVTDVKYAPMHEQCDEDGYVSVREILHGKWYICS